MVGWFPPGPPRILDCFRDPSHLTAGPVGSSQGQQHTSMDDPIALLPSTNRPARYPLFSGRIPAILAIPAIP
jgi:hypothetical protein